MRPSTRSTEVAQGSQPGQAVDDDAGSASLEFILAGLVLLVPLLYLVVALGAIQSSALGVEAGARHLARSIASAPDAATADARAERIRAAVAEEYGISADALEVAVACEPAGAECPAAGATLIVTAATRVALPLVPDVLGIAQAAAVPVEAVAVQKVSRYWGTAP
jgi:Flp pilus assembly protein TadG